MSSSVPRSYSLQAKLLGSLTFGLVVILLCALAGLGSAWLSLSTDVPPQVAQATDGERLSRDFRLQVQEWKNILIRGHDDEQRIRYTKAFDEKGREVATLAGMLSASLVDPDAQRLADFRRSMRRWSATIARRLSSSPPPATTRNKATPW